MRAECHYVEFAACAFDDLQAKMNKAKARLDAELYRAFAELCGGIKGGDRIESGGLEGRAVIQRNGTQLGLYLRAGSRLYPIRLPYKEHATKINWKPKPKETPSWY